MTSGKTQPTTITAMIQIPRYTRRTKKRPLKRWLPGLKALGLSLTDNLSEKTPSHPEAVATYLLP